MFFTSANVPSSFGPDNMFGKIYQYLQSSYSVVFWGWSTYRYHEKDHSPVGALILQNTVSMALKEVSTTYFGALSDYIAVKSASDIHKVCL